MPEIILPIVFILSTLMLKLISRRFQFALSARIAMAVMLVITGLSHFVFTKGMMMMLPDFLPFKTAMVYVTGVVEILAAIGILIPGYQKITGWLLILFFILILPANIYAAMNELNIKTGTYDGKGTDYLFYRIPLQLFFIAWVYFSCIKYGDQRLK